MAPAQCPQAAWAQERDLNMRGMLPPAPAQMRGRAGGDCPQRRSHRACGSQVSVSLASKDSDAEAGLCLCLLPREPGGGRGLGGRWSVL